MRTTRDDGAEWREVVGWLREDRAAGIPTTGPRVVEVWTLCAECAEPVRMLGTSWHHQGPADHGAVLALENGWPPANNAAHAYALADLLASREKETR